MGLLCLQTDYYYCLTGIRPCLCTFIFILFLFRVMRFALYMQLLSHMHYCSLVAYQIQVMSLLNGSILSHKWTETEEKKQQSDCKHKGHQQLVSELRFQPEQHSLLFSHCGMLITFFHQSAIQKFNRHITATTVKDICCCSPV